MYNHVYAAKDYSDVNIIVVGGGNSAVEAALVLCERNRVLLSYRKVAFARLFKDNRRKLDVAVQSGKIKLVLSSNVIEFGKGFATLQLDNKEGNKTTERFSYQHAFVLIGAELPLKFFKDQNIKLEGEWTGSLWKSMGFAFLALIGLAIWGGDRHIWNEFLLGWVPNMAGTFIFFTGVTGLLYGGFVKKERFSWLFFMFLICYTIYGVKVGSGSEFWPFRGWGNNLFSFFGRPWPFWYTVLYTAVMTIFGLSAMKKWGFV